MTSRHSSFSGDPENHGIWNTPTQSPQQRRVSTFDSIWTPFNPMSPPMSQDATPDFRRHSVGELYPSEESHTVALVNEYFTRDPHRRVQVTAAYLGERFFSDETYQLPKFPVDASLRASQLVLVGFKAGRVDVFHLPGTPELRFVGLGDLVIVEADRGRDLGKICRMNVSIDEARLLKLLQHREQQSALGEHDDNMPPLHFPKSIISLATKLDIFQILNKKQDEEKACRLCLAKIANTTSLVTSSDLGQMKLIDAEYQFDRKKLIFYYATSKRIDFRELVRELFRIYKTRIWMCAVVGVPYVSSASGQSFRKKKAAKRRGQAQVQAPAAPTVPSFAPAVPQSFQGAQAQSPQSFQGAPAQTFAQSAPASAQAAPAPTFASLQAASAPMHAPVQTQAAPASAPVPTQAYSQDPFAHAFYQAHAAPNWTAYSLGGAWGGSVPRKFQAPPPTDESAEGFVLKSLVDQINH